MKIKLMELIWTGQDNLGDTGMTKEFYKNLIIDSPVDGENPFEYNKGDKPYFIWLTNRNMACSRLMPEQIPNARATANLSHGENFVSGAFAGGYTDMELRERLFCLYMGDTGYNEIWKLHLEDELRFLKVGLSEQDEAADGLMFVYKEGKESPVRITDAAWKWHPNLIKELTGKELYNVTDTRKIINSMRNGSDTVYACIGTKTVWHEYWH